MDLGFVYSILCPMIEGASLSPDAGSLVNNNKLVVRVVRKVRSQCSGVGGKDCLGRNHWDIRH